ncbi:MAG: undecaprenyl-diphosphate phosphatase [Flavobacteriaceae bacterium]|jgi:undecaprenyl-diphosphatase|nr:undecaprenyl-diphosphate phosphatase [Flavobacteriaceae bacterium]MBT6127195.1 undecaprenyl-diphosphate phosphatase [Flavobacteriaceae bacterium]MDG1028334.1 undecaprenyl-diphosphate phosphatase [Flavobacteriaceae bacterium]
MSALETLILGVVQGLTEFLPVSSSGHLELVKAIFGSDYEQQQGLLVTITLHAATAFSTIFVFRKDIALILSDLLHFKKGESLNFSMKIILSMIPAVIIGLFFEGFIASLFDGKIALVGAMLMITALLLILADRVNENNKKLNYTKAFSIGVIQAIAILPGISRSGATIALAVLLKIDRDKAAQFSFLMVIPLILGSMAKSIMDGDLSQESTALLPLLVGFVSAFITGVFACRWMIALVKKSQLKSFSIYCVAVGVIAILFSL